MHLIVIIMQSMTSMLVMSIRDPSQCFLWEYYARRITIEVKHTGNAHFTNSSGRLVRAKPVNGTTPVAELFLDIAEDVSTGPGPNPDIMMLPKGVDIVAAGCDVEGDNPSDLVVVDAAGGTILMVSVETEILEVSILDLDKSKLPCILSMLVPGAV